MKKPKKRIHNGRGNNPLNTITIESFLKQRSGKILGPATVVASVIAEPLFDGDFLGCGVKKKGQQEGEQDDERR
jgi:hypothetical protein